MQAPQRLPSTQAPTHPPTHSPATQVGLANGVLLRSEVDRVTGQLSDTRTRFLGTRAPRLFGAAVRGDRSMLALSSRPWLGYSDHGRFNLVPMSYEPLDWACGERARERGPLPHRPPPPASPPH